MQTDADRDRWVPPGQPAQPQTTPQSNPRPMPALTAVLLLGSVILASGLIARRDSPDPTHPGTAFWYRSLRKPGWKPADPLFGLIWPVLQVASAYGAYRLLNAPPSPPRNRGLVAWFASMALVTGWSRAFLGWRSPAAGVADALLLVFSAGAYLWHASRVDRLAAWAGAPLAAWSIFGAVMTERVRELNDQGRPRAPGGGRRRGLFLPAAQRSGMRDEAGHSLLGAIEHVVEKAA